MGFILTISAGLTVAISSTAQEKRPDADFRTCIEMNRQKIECTHCPSTSSLTGLAEYLRRGWHIQFDIDEMGKAKGSSITFFDLPRGSNEARMKVGAQAMLAGNRFDNQGEVIKGAQCKMTYTR